MLYSSPIFSQASGSVAGLTFAHSRAGMTVRARTSPTNPDTPRQRTIKHAVASLSPYWANILTQDMRDAWDLYGAIVVMTNALGQPFHLTGLNHFMRANVPRLQAGIAVIVAAPTTFDLGTFTAPALIDADEAPPRYIISINGVDHWANNVGGHMLFYEGRPANVGQKYFGGPFRFGDKFDGHVGAPTFSVNVTSVWKLTTGNLLWVQIRIIQVDGRLSMPIGLGPFTVQ